MYMLQHANAEGVTPSHEAPWFSETVVSHESALPRVGDTIELDGFDYQVIVVWHHLRREREPERCYAKALPTVRVK